MPLDGKLMRRNLMHFILLPLQKKYLGEKLNFDLEGDIELTVNSSINWYMGTDGKTPALTYRSGNCGDP